MNPEGNIGTFPGWECPEKSPAHEGGRGGQQSLGGSLFRGVRPCSLEPKELVLCVNLAGLSHLVTQSNANLGVAVEVFCMSLTSTIR